MKEHEHPTKNTPETEPAQDEVAKKAYAIYLKEGRPQGHAEQNWLEAEAQMQHAGSDHPGDHDHHDHHAHMAADFRKRFWISLVLTLPILVLSPMLQTLVGLREAIRFPGDLYVLFGFLPRSFGMAAGRFSKGFSRNSNPAVPG
jgi:P-type Cu2+ transporter